MHYFRSMAVLTIQHLSKAWAEEKVVDDISFSVQPSEQLAIVGETGSGKTTLLKMMGGLLQPDAGSIFLGSKKVPGPDEVLIPGHKKIRYLSQHFELRNNYRVYEIMDMANKIDQAEADKIINICRVAHLQNRWSDELSGGEKQRIALARVLIASPQVLLLDEPFSNLDAAHKKTMQGVLRDLSKQMQITSILVSHDAADILSWADNVLVMQKGKLLQKAAPQDIYYHPLNEYVAALTGDYNKITIGHALHPGAIEGPGEQPLLVRPQHIRLLPAGETGVKGIVQRVLFMGSHFITEVSLGDHTILSLSSNQHFVAGTPVSLQIEL